MHIADGTVYKTNYSEAILLKLESLRRPRKKGLILRRLRKKKDEKEGVESLAWLPEGGKEEK